MSMCGLTKSSTFVGLLGADLPWIDMLDGTYGYSRSDARSERERYDRARSRQGVGSNSCGVCRRARDIRVTPQWANVIDTCGRMTAEIGGREHVAARWQPACPNRSQRRIDGQHSGAQRDLCLAQLAAPVVPGGPSSTVGTYSNSWSPPSKVRLSTRSSLMSGYPS